MKINHCYENWPIWWKVYGFMKVYINSLLWWKFIADLKFDPLIMLMKPKAVVDLYMTKVYHWDENVFLW